MKSNCLNLMRCLLIIVAVLSLSACTTYKNMVKPQKGYPAIDQINSEIQGNIAVDQQIDNMPANEMLSPELTNALLPDLSIDQPDKAQKVEHRFNISVNEAPARDFFMSLVKDTKYNMVVSPNVQGTVTLHLKNVTIPEALDAVRDNYGYQYEETPYGFHVFPPGLESRVFILNYLDVDRNGKSNTLISSGQITQKVTGGSGSGSSSSSSSAGKTSSLAATSSIETTSKSEFWEKVTTSLQSIIGDKEGRKVVVNPEGGIVIVKAYPDELQEVSHYLDTLQSTMTRQVIIDAKIMEVTLSNDYQAGIDWSILGLQQEGVQKFSDDLPALTASMFTLNASYRGAFSTLVKLLSSQGNVQVLSSPRISTLNNQKAVIKVGSDEFFITNISDTTVGTGSTTQNTQDIELTPFFSGISLDVTPEINARGEVILHIHPTVSTVTDDTKSFTVSGQAQELPLAKSAIRESDNIVSAKNGQIIVIAGLMEDKTSEYQGSTPVLDKVPVIGPLFRKTNQSSVKSELIILLRPIVVGNNAWTKQLREASLRVKKLDRGFHIGGFPQVFGNEAS